MKRLPESVKHRVVQLFHTCSFLQQLHLFAYIFFKQETWKGYRWTFSLAGNLLNKFTLGFGRWKVGERSLSMNKSFYDRQHNQPTHLFSPSTIISHFKLSHECGFPAGVRVTAKILRFNPVHSIFNSNLLIFWLIGSLLILQVCILNAHRDSLVYQKN